jgi:hypothetical protein
VVGALQDEKWMPRSAMTERQREVLGCATAEGAGGCYL